MRKALLIGIDDYGDRANPLKGCVNDANRLKEVLSSHEDGAPNFECRSILAGPDEATERAVLKEIDALFSSEADFVLLHFSGHGTVNNLGGYLMTQGTEAYNEGVRMAGVLDIANQSSGKVKEALIILDCCHSGAFGNLPDVDNKVELKEGRSVLTASRDSQIAMENGEAGLFASLVADGLMGGAADILGRVTVGSLYAYVDQALGPWDQRPLFKSHISRFTSIRNCKPAVDPRVIRQLTTYFDKPTATVPLDPSFEPSAEPANADNEAVFANLQKMRAARLVEPVTEEHLYWEAMRDGACRLTRLGQYYWMLVDSKRI